MSDSEPDPHVIVRTWGKFASEVSPLVSPFALLVRAAAATDPALASVLDEADAQRLERMRHNTRKLARRGFLRAGMTVNHAADIAWALVAPEMYELLVVRRGWSPEQFGQFIGEVMAAYGTQASRRKPELIDQDSFPIGAEIGPVLDGGQFGDIVEDWRRLVGKVEAIKTRLRPDQQDAYFQLVEYPVLAVSNLYEMYYATAWNRRLASRNDARANAFADQVDDAVTAGELVSGGKPVVQTRGRGHVGYSRHSSKTPPMTMRPGGPCCQRRRRPFTDANPA